MKISRRVVAVAFGQTLRLARKYRGLTQDELAAEAEIDRTYPSLLERGKRTPTITVILQLADPLRITPMELLARVVARNKELLRRIHRNSKRATVWESYR